MESKQPFNKLKEHFQPLSDEEYARKVAVKATRKALKKLEKKRGLPWRRKRILELTSEARNVSENTVGNMLSALVVHKGDVEDKKVYIEGIDKNIAHDATHDPLTGVLNRRGIENYLRSFELVDESVQPQGVLYVDLTNFKAVNDHISHERGDEVLKAISIILGTDLREGDAVGRLGGDEFVIVLHDDRRDENTTEHEQVSNKSIVDVVTERIATGTHHYLMLSGNEDLREMGFNAAVGGIEWQPDHSIAKILNEAEAKMKLEKQRQHAAFGKHR